MGFPERLNQLIEENNLKYSRLAQDIGVQPAVVARWKNGENKPNQEGIEKIADYFDVSVDYLLGRTDNPAGIVVLEVGREGKDPGEPLTPEETEAVNAFLEGFRARNKKDEE
ncbi:helix-turn-helix domain-containing protein [Eubacteriales bacterium OttesenSCG-928-M02]|nr:helix-turn-helix domain-containing protein [Eubacteriales bacterium OttesenSCG-928-M02]